MPLNSQRGFTLIEMMITITILATLTILTSQSIQQAVTQKGKIQTSIDSQGMARDALGIVKKDISLAYHYRDLELELLEAVENGETTDTTTPTTPETEGEAPTTPRTRPGARVAGQSQTEKPNRQDPTTHFVGTTNEVSFATRNHSRVLAGGRSADFAEVGYALKSCRSRVSKTQSNCLWRRSSSYVDSEVTRGGNEIVLVENVDEFSLRYIGEGKQDWVNEWRTTEEGDAVTKGNFPDAVEVTLVVSVGEGEKTRKIPLQAIVPLHFPNNKEKTDEDAQVPTFER